MLLSTSALVDYSILYLEVVFLFFRSLGIEKGIIIQSVPAILFTFVRGSFDSDKCGWDRPPISRLVDDTEGKGRRFERNEARPTKTWTYDVPGPAIDTCPRKYERKKDKYSYSFR